MLKPVLFALALWPLTASAAPSPQWDQPMPVLARIEWTDPLNPALVPVGQGRFLFDTVSGVRLWDATTAQFLGGQAEAASGRWPERLLFGPANNAALAAGPLLLGLSRNEQQATVWAWSAAQQTVGSPVALQGPFPKAWRLQGLDAQPALLCHYRHGARVMRWAAGSVGPEEVKAGDAQARGALLARGIVGPVQGFGSLALGTAAPPVFYDTQRCGWELTQPPADLAPHLDRQRRGDRHPTIKPYFLSDGRVLVSELEYFDTVKPGWRWTSNPLLWDAAARAWRPLAAFRSERPIGHRSGQQEPVLAAGRGASLVEALHLPTLSWRRFNEALPRAYNWLLEPLPSGQVLVLNRATEPELRGGVGRVTPSDGTVPPGRLHYGRSGQYQAALVAGRAMLLVGTDGTRDSDAAEWVDAASTQSTELPRLPAGTHWPVFPTGVALADGSVLVLAGLPRACSRETQFVPEGECADRVGQPSWRYRPGAPRWEPVPALRIPYSRGPSWQWGNSDRSTQWPRVDLTVRANGDLVWLQGGEFPESRERELWPRSTVLMAWSPSRADAAPRRIAPLRKGRVSGSLLALADGRLVVMGGDAQLDRVALEKTSAEGPDEFVSIGPMRSARSTEVLDESDPNGPRWVNGPMANFPGGQGFRLANGRIVKLSLREPMGENGVQAEVADAAFTAWTRLPTAPAVSPARGASYSDIRFVTAVGNRLLVLTDSDVTLVWDDETGRWNLHAAWPGLHEGLPPESVMAAAKPGWVLVRYPRTVRLMELPKN